MEISKVLGLPDFVKANLLPLEVNFYGAAKLVADRLGIQDPPVSHVSWQHGWKPEDIVDVNQLAFDSHIGVIGHPDAKVVIPAHKRRPYLVATQAYATLLRENGFPDSRAVGLPFTYVEPDQSARRIPGSLLVMPAHVLMRMECGRANEIEYLEYIKSIAHQFTRVVFCINLGCLASGLWIHNLNQYGFDYVFGAGMMDQAALLRMRKLFDSFEYMTSNGIGSHFLYAGLCGVKVSLDGPFDNPNVEELYKNEPEWQDPVRRKALHLSSQTMKHSHLQKKFPHLYTIPKESTACVEWARQESGYYNRVSFEELAQLFGWRVAPASRGESFRERALRLDASDNVNEFVQFAQGAPHNPDEMLSALVHLLSRSRVRSAYILAMLLAKRGVQHAAIAFARSVGGILYNNPTEAGQGLSHLPALTEGLAGEQQQTWRAQVVVPVLSPLLADEQSDASRIPSLLAVAGVADPSLRELLAQTEHETPPQRARRVLQSWQLGQGNRI